jgi:hypothetical protein
MKALSSSYGIIVESDNRELLRQKLYAIRRTSPLYDNIALVFHPTQSNQLLIIRKDLNV